MKNITALIFTFLFWSAGAQAALLTFDSLDSTVGLDDTFIVDIVGLGFPDTEGGGINLFYDETIVNVLSVSIDGSLWDFSFGNSTGSVDNVNGEVIDITVAALPAVSLGDFVVASVQFKAVGFGATDLTLADSTLNNPGARAVARSIRTSPALGSMIREPLPCRRCRRYRSCGTVAVR